MTFGVIWREKLVQVRLQQGPKCPWKFRSNFHKNAWIFTKLSSQLHSAKVWLFYALVDYNALLHLFPKFSARGKGVEKRWSSRGTAVGSRVEM